MIIKTTRLTDEDWERIWEYCEENGIDADCDWVTNHLDDDMPED